MRNSLSVMGVGLTALLAIGGLPAAASAQPAPALSGVRVLGVASPGYANGSSWDYIPPGGVATPNPHGGPWLLVAVLEQGYAGGQRAVYNTFPMTLVFSEAQYNANRQIVGYVRYYRVTGQPAGGTFSYAATSVVSPYRTYTTSLRVR